jgi:hypothetical protein
MAASPDTLPALKNLWPDPASLPGFAGEVIQLLSSVDDPGFVLEAVIERQVNQLRAIEALVNLLDTISPDPEAEPSLGWTSGQAASGRYAPNSASDLEQPLGWTAPEGRTGRNVPDPEEREPDTGFEPSLGSVDSLNQQGWAAGNRTELEDEHDGRKPDVDGEPELGWTEREARTGQYPIDPKVGWAVQDGEPSLGSLEAINQTRWSAGNRDDREEQCEDEGAQDEREPDHEDGFDGGIDYVPASRGTSPLGDGPLRFWGRRTLSIVRER